VLLLAQLSTSRLVMKSCFPTMADQFLSLVWLD